MIDSIQIAKRATFGRDIEALDGLSKFNYIFGSNGSGKTTITRVIADEASFPTCRLTWKNGTKLQTMVYNSDFISQNFSQFDELKGIFTLGEKNVETLSKIADASEELNTIKDNIGKFERTLMGEEDDGGGKQGELLTLKNEFKEKCWKAYEKHKVELEQAFKGYKHNKESFKNKVILEKDTNSETIQSLEALEERAKTVYGPPPAKQQLISSMDAENLIAHESNPILKKRVIGKEDVDIAAMIDKLGNSDWVREGRTFYEMNDRVCPFCQQRTTTAFAQSLNEYFDDTFQRDTGAIDDLRASYKADSERLQQQITAVIATKSMFLNNEKLQVDKDLLDSKITINMQHLLAKKSEPSKIVELEPISSIVSSIEELIEAANLQVTEHNATVDNLAHEQEKLTAQVWKYLVEEDLKDDLTECSRKLQPINKAIENIKKKLATEKEQMLAKEQEIQNLERNTTSIQPTVYAINGLLSSFGFRGFSLAVADNGISYKLIRADGADAKETLSEGEKNFVTFLYFYHLLKGSDSETGITRDRIVVFDDPVSSLDSNILFIVSNLVRGLFGELRNGAGHIKQIFVFTHNVYFYKEVTFDPRRGNNAMNEETFWVVRKPDLESKLEKHDSNPVKTSYELLWSEVRRPDRSNLTIQNTLRRILENYFKILGGVDPDTICTKFEGNEKLVCTSLFSWINDGSHFALDDDYLSINDWTVDTYLKVFRDVFDKSGQLGHYEMMMGSLDADIVPQRK
jgi:wobble nucleotide-excising tRNase